MRTYCYGYYGGGGKQSCLIVLQIKESLTLARQEVKKWGQQGHSQQRFIIMLLTSTISVRCKRMPCKTIGGSRDIKPNQSHLDGWSTFHPGRLRQFRPIWPAYFAWHDWRSLCRRVQPDRTPSNIVQILNKSKNV